MFVSLCHIRSCWPVHILRDNFSTKILNLTLQILRSKNCKISGDGHPPSREGTTVLASYAFDASVLWHLVLDMPPPPALK